MSDSGASDDGAEELEAPAAEQRVGTPAPRFLHQRAAASPHRDLGRIDDLGDSDEAGSTAEEAPNP